MVLRAETSFDSVVQYLLHHPRRQPPAGASRKADDLAVTAIKHKGHGHFLSVVASEFEAVRASTLVGGSHGDTAVVVAGGAGQMRFNLVEQKVFRPEQSINTFAVDMGFAFL